MTNEYPPGYVLRIKALDAIILLGGLCVLAAPVLLRFYPGDIDTTVHVTFGMLIAVCAVFRVLVAYGSAWLEVVLCGLGVLTSLLPKFMHEMYNPLYNTAHLTIGIVIIALSIISGLMTFAHLRATDARRA